MLLNAREVDVENVTQRSYPVRVYKPRRLIPPMTTRRSSNNLLCTGGASGAEASLDFRWPGQLVNASVIKPGFTCRKLNDPSEIHVALLSDDKTRTLQLGAISRSLKPRKTCARFFTREMCETAPRSPGHRHSRSSPRDSRGCRNDELRLKQSVCSRSRLSSDCRFSRGESKSRERKRAESGGLFRARARAQINVCICI